MSDGRAVCLRSALRWHARYWGEVLDVGFEEARAVLACLAEERTNPPSVVSGPCSRPWYLGQSPFTTFGIERL